MPSSGQMVEVFRKREPEISYSSQSPSPLPPNIFLVLGGHGLTHFATSPSPPLPSILHTCSQSFQNVNLTFSLSHLLLNTFSGFLPALRIKTKILNAAWSGPSPPRHRLHHPALYSASCHTGCFTVSW